LECKDALIGFPFWFTSIVLIVQTFEWQQQSNQVASDKNMMKHNRKNYQNCFAHGLPCAIIVNDDHQFFKWTIGFDGLGVGYPFKRSDCSHFICN